jgi:heme A synthase
MKIINRSVNLIVAALALTGTAWAQQPAPTPATPQGAATPSTAAPSSPTGPQTTPDNSGAKANPSELNFDLFGEEKKKSPLDEAREKERLAKLERSVSIRRKLLLSHQALGFTTLALLATTVIIGQLNYDDKYTRDGTDTGQFKTAHLGLGITTATLFAATGICAIAAPNPYPKPVKLDAALVHKVSMAVATAGMVLQIILGPITATRDGKLDQRDFALAHVITGYATFGFMATGVLAYVF